MTNGIIAERGRDFAGMCDSYELTLMCIFYNKGNVAHTRPVPHKVYQSSGCSFNNAISRYALLSVLTPLKNVNA